MFLDLKQYPTDIAVREMQMLQEILATNEKVKFYEDEVLQAQARSIIPVEQLVERAVKQMQDNPFAIGVATAVLADQSSPAFRDQLLLQLLRWFKVEFFSWFDTPQCPIDGQKGTSFEAVQPTTAELALGASRVESYQCPACRTVMRFPRYNNPASTNKFFCKWCDFLVRFRLALDATDHVWTEVWSELKQRWLHCDSCENVCDRPLLYEQGWDKKLSYVIAYSSEQVVDVSWRYSLDHRAMLARRLNIREKRLIDIIRELNEQKLQLLSEARKATLRMRTITEVVELLSPIQQSRDGSNTGRTSGSLQWRQLRGELGYIANETEGTILTPTGEEVERKEFLLHFYCANDRYVRPQLNESHNGFDSLAFRVQNLFRKEEFDWKMAYVCRNEDTDGDVTGSIEWKINLQNMTALSAEITIDSYTNEGGVVSISCCAGDKCFHVHGGRLMLTEEDLHGCTSLSVSATLSGGRGRCVGAEGDEQCVSQVCERKPKKIASERKRLPTTVDDIDRSDHRHLIIIDLNRRLSN